MEAVNIWAVLVAAVVSFLVGGVWFSMACFGKTWMREVKLTEDQIANANMKKVFGLAFVFTFIVAYCLATFISTPEVTGLTGAFYGFLAGFGWIFFAFAVNGLFEQKSWRYTLISGGYWVVVLTLMGAIIGFWR